MTFAIIRALAFASNSKNEHANASAILSLARFYHRPQLFLIKCVFHFNYCNKSNMPSVQYVTQLSIPARPLRQLHRIFFVKLTPWTQSNVPRYSTKANVACIASYLIYFLACLTRTLAHFPVPSAQCSTTAKLP